MPAQRNFKDWIEAYVEYTAASEAPESFHRWTAIATIAGALRRRVRLDMGHFRWFPNFYLCFVAPPGIVSKSTTADIGMGLLRQVPGIRFGPNTVTWQALVSAFANGREDYPLADGTFMPMSALTLVASELGTFLQPGDKAIINLLTELWDGRDTPFLKQTKKDGEEVIVNPWVNLVACTTPSWIADNFDDYFITGGFASRILFVYADHKRQLVAYPESRLSPEHKRLERHLVADLTTISELSGTFELGNAAREWGIAWYEKHFEGSSKIREDKRFGGYFARKQTHLHKTAMVLSAARSNSLRIAEYDLTVANGWVTELEEQMLEVFQGMNREKITDFMGMILGTIRESGRISRDSLYKVYMTQLGYTTFADCLNGLLQANLIRVNANGDAVTISYNAQALEERVRGRRS